MRMIDWTKLKQRWDDNNRIPEGNHGECPSHWAVLKTRETDTFACGCPLGSGVIRAPTYQAAWESKMALRRSVCCGHNPRYVGGRLDGSPQFDKS